MTWITNLPNSVPWHIYYYELQILNEAGEILDKHTIKSKHNRLPVFEYGVNGLTYKLVEKGVETV